MAWGRLQRQGSVEAVVDAPVDAVWDVVSDPTRTGEWSHEARRHEWRAGSGRATPGARFRGHNRVGPIRWTRECEVLAVDPPHEIAWRTVPTPLFPDSTEWRLRVEPADGGGTRIVQSFRVLRLHPLLDRLFWLVLPPHRDRSAALTADLDRIGRRARDGGAP